MANAAVKVNAQVKGTVAGVAKDTSLEVTANAQDCTLATRLASGAGVVITVSTSQLHAILAAARALEVEQ